MRLLIRKSSGWLARTDTFGLVDCDRSKTYHYAILSHRWGPDEVTIQDIKDGAARRKAGCKKLDFVAEQAARDGLLYSWVDTCCIDKSNNTELSEAINSMFKWYQNATKCYVYLPDVSKQGDWKTAFQQSEWFTRGWTLQELIAPAVVEFYSAEGLWLGDKQTLEQEIHQATGISIDALRNRSLATINQEERFSWTARRQTTVPEDAVYCLLGIFNVHMPLIYGEGQEKALARFQREIKIAADPNLFITDEAPWIVPFERNPNFTGRESLLADLESRLFPKTTTSKIAVTGLGGIGKTQLVLELLYRTREKRKECTMLWIPAVSLESLQQGFLNVAQQLEIPCWDNTQVDAKKLVQNHLSRKEAGPWILVFDNADDISHWTRAPSLHHEHGSGTSSGVVTASHRLMNYLPQHTQGCIIFTTRNEKAAVQLAGRNILTVPMMSEEAATRVLSESLRHGALVSNTQEVKVLLVALTYLPLAITQAAAYINANSITLAEYISFLSDTEEEMIEILSEDFEDYGRYESIKNPVATTWLISFEQIRRSDPLAAEYLSFMACISPRDIPQSLLSVGPSRKKETDAIGTLKAYAFVSQSAVGTTLDMHRLVRLVTRNWLRQQGMLRLKMVKTLDRIEYLFPHDTQWHRATGREYLPHAREILGSNLITRENEQRLRLMDKYGRFLLGDGRWDEAESIFTDLMSIEVRNFGADHLDTLRSMHNLAVTYQRQGRYNEAKPLQVQVLELRKVRLGTDHPDTLLGLNNLASTYRSQGEYDKAELLQVQALDMYKTKLWTDHPDTLTCMSNLAAIYRDQGRYNMAELLQMQALEMYKTKLGVDHPSTLTGMSELALTYRCQGQYKKAELLQVQALEMYKTKLGIDHPSTLSGMSDLAMTYFHQGHYSTTEPLQVRVLEMYKKKLGVYHPSTITGMSNLASTYSFQGRYDMAEPLEMQVVEMYKMKLGMDHPHTLASMRNLAVTYSDRGQHKKAESLQAQVLEMRTIKLGPDDLGTLKSMGDLALTYTYQGRHNEAEPLQVQVLELRKVKLGTDHPDTLAGMSDLALTYHSQGEYDKAESLQVQVLDMYKTKLGWDHPFTLSGMHNLAWTYRDQARKTRAIHLMRDCADRRSRILGTAHPAYLSSTEILRQWENEESEINCHTTGIAHITRDSFCSQ